jgi:hypothetical protein
MKYPLFRMNEPRHTFKQAAAGEIRYRNSALPFDVFFRSSRAEDGRPIITELRIVNPAGVNAGDLRQLRLGPIEGFLASINKMVDSYRTVVAATEPLQRITWDLRAPSVRPYPDEFFKTVAESYLACLQISNSPAPVLAAAWSVPVTTVHGWIKQARARGFLPPGRKGKVG